MLSHEATGLRYISVYWDWEEGYWHRVCRERFAICVCIREDPWVAGNGYWWVFCETMARIFGRENGNTGMKPAGSQYRVVANIAKISTRNFSDALSILFFVPFLRIRTHCSAYSAMLQPPKLPEEPRRLYEFGFLCICWCIE